MMRNVKKITANSNNRGGFTLVEIMVVVAIILILIGILLSIGAGARDRAKRRATLSELKILEAAMRDYLKINREPLPPLQGSWPYPASPSPAYDNFNANMFTLDPASNSNPANQTHLCSSDITNWVAQLLADQEAAAKLSNLPKGQDISTPTPYTVILDAWGTPIRYVPSHSGSTANINNPTIAAGFFYFISAGADGRFSMSVNNTGNNWPVDEIYSTDSQ